MDKILSDKHFKKSRSLSDDVKFAYDIVENTNVVVFDWTTDINLPTNFVSTNVSQFGYTPEDFYSGSLKDYWEFVYIEDRERIKNTIYKVRETELLEFKHNYRIITKDNSVRWIEERIIFQRDKDNKILSERGIIIDITEIKELEQELKKSHKKYESIFENSSAIIIIIKPDGKVESVNRKFVECLGYSKSEIHDKYINEIIEKNDSERIKQKFPILINYYKMNVDKVIEMKMVSKNGDIRYFSGSINVLKENDVLINVEIVATDITEKKKDEERIRHLVNHDILTDIYNRTFYEEELKRIQASNSYPYSIIVGDVNGLKEVNDVLGHEKGDLLLKKIAVILKKSCRVTDVIARIGGDEFAVICPNTSSKSAQIICNRISELCEIEGKNSLIKPSIALGFATEYYNKEKTNVIFKEADDKMYKNKLTFSQSSRSSFLFAQQNMLEEKTLETREHANQIRKFALEIGKKLHFTQDKLDLLSLTALMHDVGKIGVPSEILMKKGKLNNHEFEMIKKHSLIGYNILKTSLTTKEIGKYVLHHHESWDGSGYPDGLKGYEIPLISRIISIADAYVVMINGRPFKKKMNKQEVINELKRCSNLQFDPALVKLFIKILNEK